MLQQCVDNLLRHVSSNFRFAPTPESIGIAEIRHDRASAGDAKIVVGKIQSISEYEARFEELLALGFGWINISYCGLRDGKALLVVEYPRSIARHVGTTPVNFSGPPKMVIDAGWDASVYVEEML